MDWGLLLGAVSLTGTGLALWFLTRLESWMVDWVDALYQELDREKAKRRRLVAKWRRRLRAVEEKASHLAVDVAQLDDNVASLARAVGAPAQEGDTV